MNEHHKEHMVCPMVFQSPAATCEFSKTPDDADLVKTRMGTASGGAFITPHAIYQFIERIAPLPHNQALAAILHSLETAGAQRVTRNGKAVYIRTKTPYRFRAIIRPPLPGLKLPAVVTILRG